MRLKFEKINENVILFSITMKRCTLAGFINQCHKRETPQEPFKNIRYWHMKMKKATCRDTKCVHVETIGAPLVFTCTDTGPFELSGLLSKSPGLEGYGWGIIQWLYKGFSVCFQIALMRVRFERKLVVL